MTKGPSMELGMCTTGTGDVVATARRLEDLGFDYMGVGEHISFHLPTSSPLIALAAAAAVTTRIKLLSSILMAPIYPATLLAKMGATLDDLSGGRFNLGVGVAGENPAEIAACGVDPKQRGRRADECLQIVRRLWTEETVSHDGEWATLREISIRPRPAQQPNPPIWVSGRKDAAIRRAARLGDGWMPYLFTPEMFSASITTLAAMCDAEGRDPSEVRSAAFVFASCAEDPAVARQNAVDRLSRQYDQDFSQLVDRYVVWGDPSACVSRLTEYMDAGAQTIFLGSACSDETAEANQILLAREVLPALRALSP